MLTVALLGPTEQVLPVISKDTKVVDQNCWLTHETNNILLASISSSEAQQHIVQVVRHQHLPVGSQCFLLFAANWPQTLVVTSSIHQTRQRCGTIAPNLLFLMVSDLA